MNETNSKSYIDMLNDIEQRLDKLKSEIKADYPLLEMFSIDFVVRF